MPLTQISIFTLKVEFDQKWPCLSLITSKVTSYMQHIICYIISKSYLQNPNAINSIYKHVFLGIIDDEIPKIQVHWNGVSFCLFIVFNHESTFTVYAVVYRFLLHNVFKTNFFRVHARLKCPRTSPFLPSTGPFRGSLDYGP